MLSRIYFLPLLLLITGCTNPYHEHFFRENPEFTSQVNMVSGEMFQASGRIDSLPNSHTQTELIHRMDDAKNRIWIEIYTWTDAAKLVDPIIRAHNR
jgi:hypothetical protein